MQWTPEQQLPPDFLAIAKEVYKDDPFWIPENTQQLTQSFGPGNPYFQQGRAWLSVAPGQARLAGFFNPTLKVEGRSVAFFGYWESQDQLLANQGLFAEFEGWAREQGAEAVYGPINFTTYGEYRIRLSSFERGALPSEPYNPPYYEAILQQLGYQLSQGYYSIFSEQVEQLPARFAQRVNNLEVCEDAGFTVSALTPEYMLENLEKIFEISDAVFSENFAYSPIPFSLFKSVFGESFVRRICQHTSVKIESPEGDLAACLVAFPDYAPLVNQGASARLSRTELDFSQHFDLLENPVCLSKTVGVLPGYRRHGIYTKLLHEHMSRAVGVYSAIGGVLMREANGASPLADEVFTDETTNVRRYGLFYKVLVND